MKPFINALFAGTLLLAPAISLAASAGFTDSNVTFYGEVRQFGGAQTVLLQSGSLEMTFVNQSNPANRVTLSTSLQPTGSSPNKPFSYALAVPLAYLPEAPRIDEFLAIGAQETNFKIVAITIDGNPATLPDGSKEFYNLSFASRAEQYRLDLLVAGESTDTDGDGMPDWYEELHGLNPNLKDAESDFDSDGWTNLDEFRRGSNPAISNRDPQLATTSISIPESGEAGCFLLFHDSDSQAEELSVSISTEDASGVELRLDGLSIDTVATVTAADIIAGRLTLLHTDPTVREVALPLSWNDGGDPASENIILTITAPSSEDGNDATLWFDGNSLPTVGESVATWNDRSGNSRDAIQAVDKNQPQVTLAGNHRSIDFQKPNSHLFFQDPALPHGDHTILVAYHSEGTPKSPQVIMSSNRGFLRLEPTAEAISYPGAPHYQIDGVAVRGFESTLQSSATSIFRREGSILQNAFGLSSNGEQITSESLDAVLPTLGARRIATPSATPIRDGFKGQLHELLVFPTALPEQKLRDVHDYLESKWSGAIIWDQSTNLKPISITAAGPGRHIIRGGHGADMLRGGTTDNTISGGPGADTLTGNTGLDRFVFGEVDTGRDILIDFDPENDLIDFSALFWGKSGDAREFLTTRLETNFENPLPTLDTVLVLQRPDATTQEIVLHNVILGETELITLIVEGRIRMGALSIPTDVSLTLAAGSDNNSTLSEDPDQSFTVEITRSGDGLAGALDVPLGLFQDALGLDLAIEGSTSKVGQRSVVRFARGESTKLVTFRPIQDLETEGTETWETAILPNFRYAISGTSATRTVSDNPMITLTVIEDDALVSGQPAVVRVTRDGSLAASIDITLDLEGSAEEGVHINPLPRSLTIPAGQASADVMISTHGSWDGARTRMTLLRLVAGSDYQIGNPHEATIYASATETQAEDAGFDRWISAATSGRFSSIHELLQSEGAARVSDYLRAYAFSEPSADQPGPAPVTFRIVDNRPELSTRLQSSRPDLRWKIQDKGRSTPWNDVASEFSQEVTQKGLRFLGPPLNDANSTRLYRLSFDVETSSGLANRLTSLAGTSQYGLGGSTVWTVDPSNGALTGTGGSPGKTSRLIVQINAPTLIQFEMAVVDGDGNDSLSFSIDGVEVSQTHQERVGFDQLLEPSDSMILMWEFIPTTGSAVITQGSK